MNDNKKLIQIYSDKVDINFKKYDKLKEIYNMYNCYNNREVIMEKMFNIIDENDTLIEKQRLLFDEINKQDPFEISLKSTVKGDIIFDETHPYYNNLIFYKALISQYIFEERYEDIIKLQSK